MKLRSKSFIFVLAVSLTACSAPIKNVDNAAVTAVSNKTLSSVEVRSAIVRAGAALGWQIKDESPTTLVGTLHLRKHTAVVEIPYSSDSYSIKYRSSENLQAKDGSIHKNYNGWIQNLTRGINAQLASQ